MYFRLGTPQGINELYLVSFFESVEDNPKNPKHKNRKTTTCHIENINHSFTFVGKSFCHPRDQYNRTQGRLRAFAKALNDHFVRETRQGIWNQINESSLLTLPNKKQGSLIRRQKREAKNSTKVAATSFVRENTVPENSNPVDTETNSLPKKRKYSTDVEKLLVG